MLNNPFFDLRDEREAIDVGWHYYKAARVLRRYLKENLIIFPYGRNGRIVENVLNQFGKMPEFVLDNRLCKKAEGIFPLSKLKEISVENYIVILSSDLNEIYAEIRDELLDYVPIDRVVDVYSKSLFFDQEAYYDSSFFDRNDIQFARRSALERASREIYRNRVDGAVAEVGVYRGDFAGSISMLFPERKLYLFDTFEGFDDRDIDEREKEWSSDFRIRADHKDTSVELALSHIIYKKRAVVRKGYFPDTAEGLEKEKFAFVSLDTDLYKPIWEGLCFFWPRMSPGGYIFVDDLGHKSLLGVRVAIEEFCGKHHVGYVSIDDGMDCTAVLAKPL